VLSLLISYAQTPLVRFVWGLQQIETRCHPEMVGDMLHVTLNYDLSKILVVHF